MKTSTFISKKIGRAIGDYNMIDEGDRILVGVSGGKDSLCMLKKLQEHKSRTHIKYDLVPVHFNENQRNSSALEKYFKANDIDYTIVKKVGIKKTIRNKKPCFNCSWERKVNLFQTASKFKCAKIALAHHKDDIVQTMLLNLFFAGDISTMVPNQKLFKGGISIIRPLAYIEEKMIVEYAEAEKFPKLPYKCPHGDNSTRKLMVDIIARVEKKNKSVRTNMFRAMKRVRAEYLP